MNFEDEHYVRLYIKRTVTNRRLGWEGRAVMHEMMYEFDRIGVFELDGPPEDAIELVTGLPAKIIKTGLARLLQSKTWEIRDRRLLWPRFLEGQTARRSDAARSAEYRARRRDALNTTPEPTDERDAASRGVTRSEDSSRGVTDRHAERDAVTQSHGRHETSLCTVPGYAVPGSDQTHTNARARPADPLMASLVTPADELPDPFVPDAERVALAARFGLTIDDEVGEYTAWCRREKRVCGAWQSDFELWLRRSKKFARERATKRGGPAVAKGGAAGDWPTDADVSLREGIRAGQYGAALKARLEAGQLDAALARRLIREQEQERKDRADERDVKNLLAGVGRAMP